MLVFVTSHGDQPINLFELLSFIQQIFSDLLFYNFVLCFFRFCIFIQFRLTPFLLISFLGFLGGANGCIADRYTNYCSLGGLKKL